MKRFGNNTAEEMVVNARDIKPGTYVRRVDKQGNPFKQVFTMGEYCRYNKGYELTSERDINYAIHVKGEARLQVGFTY